MASNRIAWSLVAYLGLISAAAPLTAAAGMPGPGPDGSPQTEPPPPDLLPPDLPPGGREALCALRDEALDRTNDLFQKLSLNDLFKNYYCDGGCYMCCYVPQSGACHTSFDYDDDGNPPVNCSAVYGAGTAIVGEALVYGDALGLGICIGGVQQACHHFPTCSIAGNGAAASASSSSPGFAPMSGDAPSLMAPGAASRLSGALETSSSSSPLPHPDMTLPGAAGSRAKAFVKMMLHHFTQQTLDRPAHLPHRDYVDFATARGARDWRGAMAGIEPYSGSYQAFRVEDGSGALLPEQSYRLGILYHANLGLLGAVPNVLQRLAHVESRYWSDQERDDYLAGLDPETELRRTLGPVALAALQAVPIQDWRLLAQAAPGETALGYRSYEGFELGEAPLVTAAQDCGDADEVNLAVRIDDPQPETHPDTLYPVVIEWGDGSFTRHEYDSSQTPSVFSHGYAEPGTYLAYVTASNGSGLRGMAGLVVEAEAAGGAPAVPSIATVEFDAVRAYGPALIRAGQLSFELDAVTDDGQSHVIGWSEEVTLPNAGPIALGRLVGYHDTREPLARLVLRPESSGGYQYHSIYVQLPSLTLGFYDPELGAITTRTIPATPDLFQVFYDGATQPVPAALLEHDVNGELMLPVDRTLPGLSAGFCGASPCRLVERIEIALSPALLAQRPESAPSAPADLPPGSLARWSEDVPGQFVAEPITGPATLGGACAGNLSVNVVAADEPGPGRVIALTLGGPAPIVTMGNEVELSATATLVDGSRLDVTDRVTWASSNPTALEVSNGQDKGRLTAGIVPGTSTISATLGELGASLVGTNGSPEQGFASYRFQVTRIHGAVGRAGISSAQLLLRNQVLENLMTGNASGSIGPFAAAVRSSSGGSASYAFDASLGTGWTSANGSFATVAPFAVGASPVYLQVDFEQPVPIDGVRLHRQTGFNPASFLPQFPREVVVQGSNDGITWQTLVTHGIENWNYQPADIRWSVAADTDADGLADAGDNCPAWPNADQLDTDQNGIGNACECGDQTGNGRVDVQDLVAINGAIFNPALATPLCDTNDDGRCDVLDLVGANLRIFGQPAYCARNPRP